MGDVKTLDKNQEAYNKCFKLSHDILTTALENNLGSFHRVIRGKNGEVIFEIHYNGIERKG